MHYQQYCASIILTPIILSHKIISLVRTKASIQLLSKHHKHSVP